MTRVFSFPTHGPQDAKEMDVPTATITAASGVGIGAAMLLAQEPMMSPVSADWVHVLGGMTSLGFAVWYAWYVTTRTMPEKDKQHAETIKNMVDEFRAEVKEQRETFQKFLSK